MAKSDEQLVETVARGRRAGTPFALIGIVGVVIAIVAGLVTLGIFLIWLV
jgi:hypothetical protein